MVKKVGPRLRDPALTIPVGRTVASQVQWETENEANEIPGREIQIQKLWKVARAQEAYQWRGRCNAAIEGPVGISETRGGIQVKME